MANKCDKWMKKLQELSGAVDFSYNPFEDVLKTPSPSANFVFGNTHGLPRGYTMVLYGPQKGGKTLLTNLMVGKLHQTDPDAIAIKFDTEMRTNVQLTELPLKNFGIDENRYIVYHVNSPEEIFNRIENEVQAMIQDGAPIKLVIVDSITGIQGRRAMNAKDGVMTQQIGDEAATLQVGLKRILPVIRRGKIGLILTTQLRADMDPNAKYNSQSTKLNGNGEAVKMAGAWALKHFGEYFVYVERNIHKDGRQDLQGNDLAIKGLKDMEDHEEQTGHKIRIFMRDSSVGPKGRCGEFTIDYYKGIINTHEEVFALSIARGIIERPNNRTYVLAGWKDGKWDSKDKYIEAIKTDPALYKEIVDRVEKQDLDAMKTGEYAHGINASDADLKEIQERADKEE
jgi:RecA/RadA recombinase